jgi:hypothetical protein
VPAPTATDRDAPFTVKRVKFLESTAKALRRSREFDQMREVLFVREAGDLALATSHLAQSSSASRFNAFEPHLAGMGEDGRAIALDMLIEPDAGTGAGTKPKLER